MASDGLESEFLKALKSDPEVSSAVTNPASNTDIAVGKLTNFGLSALQNVDALLSNTVDLIINQGNSSVSKLVNQIENNSTMSDEQKVIGLLKAPFDNSVSILDSLFDNGLKKGVEDTKTNATNLIRKNEIADQFELAKGNLGSPIAELIGALPIARFGSMSSTTEALLTGSSKIAVAKAITKDTIANSALIGTSELALAKLYGKSDEEAVGDALTASIIGGVGTPLVGAGLGLREFVKTDAKGLAQIKLETGQPLTNEEAGILAGGGTIETKSGRQFESEEVKKSKQAVENVEFNVSSPVAERTPIAGNVYVPTTNNPIKFKYGYDERGRVYTEESNLLSPQGTAEQKASLQIRQREGIDDAQKEVARRLEFYNRDAELRKAYGQSQAKFKREGGTPADIEARNKMQFIKDQYVDIMKNTNLIKEVRNDARERLIKLNKQSIKSDITPDDIVKKAEDKYEAQTVVSRPDNYSDRDKSLREEFKVFTEKRGDKEGFERKPLNTIQEAVTNVTRKATDSRLDVKKAIALVNKQERLKGKPMFNESKITDEQRRAYPNEIKTIEDFQARREDIMLHRNGALTDDEFRFREKRRIDDKVSREASTFKSEDEANAYSESIVKELADIGIYQDLQKTKVKFDDKKPVKKNESKNVKQDESETKEKEDAELEKSKRQHKFLVDALERYRKSKKIERGKNGRPVLSESQRRDVDEGILSHVDIANKTSPVSTNAKRQELIDKAREYASKKVNTTIAKELGIKGRFKETENIKFKDTVVDASNSVAQVTTVLLGSKRLAKLSKLYGTDTDIRNIIAEEMKRNGFINASKDTVKPLFMTENYGQMKKGLVNNVMKTQGISKDEAEKFVEAYYKASDAIAPEMVQLRNIIFDTYKKSGKTEFSWKLPDGFEVKFKLTKTKDGKISIQGDDYKVKIETEEFDEFARALMPNIIHSVDAYVARQMNRVGIPTVHDAYVVPKGMEQKAEMHYARIMRELNESNLLDDIMKSIGYEGKSLKIGDLQSEAITKSKHKLSVEHEGGSIEQSKPRTFDVSKQNTKDEVMRDYMASGNYRQIPTNQLIDSMVHEAGFSNAFSKMAREGDDVYERQIALAMQSEKYNESLAIKAPDGVNAKVFDKVQRDIFNEARAKLEYNPLLKDVVKGNRLYFDKNGKLIGSKIKSVEDIIVEEKRIARKLFKSKNRVMQSKLKSEYNVMSKAKSMKNDVVYSYDEMLTKTLADDVHNEVAKGRFDNYKTLWKQQVVNDPKFNEFNRLEAISNVYKQEVDRTAETLYKRISKIEPDKQAKIMKLVKSDYEAIRGMDEVTANQIWKDNKQIRDIAYREINQCAKALGSQSEQYGAFLNNPHLIAVRYNLPKSAEPIIDQLISIKAMKDNNAWGVLKELKDDKDLKFVLDTMTQKRLISEGQLFASSPEKIVKGYFSEVYRGNKKIDKDGKVRYDADDKYEEGVLGADRENNKVGTIYESKTPKFLSLTDELDFMTKHRLKKTDGVYRKVTGEDIRIEAGKTDDLAEVISETIRHTHQKVKERGLVHKVLIDLANDNSMLFSKTPKKGMQALTNEQLSRLPYDLRSELKYIDRELIDNLLGRNEIRLYKGENQNLKIADRLLDNLGTMFKQNVVLKNPASYLNSLLVNQTIGLSAGLTPKELFIYQRKAIRDLKEMRDALDYLTKQKLTGEKLDKALVNKLKNNRLFMMERAGLSTNRVEGVVGDTDLLSSMLEDHVASPIFKMARLLNLSQKTEAGKFTLKMFSNIDTIGRYSLVEKFMSQGMTIQDASMKANGLFGDMDKMVPPIVEMVDKYGFVPFLKWFTLTTPQLLKLTKDNPKKALALGVGVYILGQETNTNLSTVNPIEAMVDFFEGSLPFGTIDKIEKFGLLDTASNRASASVIPKYLSIAYKNPFDLVYKLRKERIGKPSNNGVDYRGFTQQVIEGD